VNGLEVKAIPSITVAAAVEAALAYEASAALDFKTTSATAAAA